MRVHELAKELDISSKDLLDFLSANNEKIKSAQNSVSEEDIASAKKKFGKKAEAPAEKPAKPVEKKADAKPADAPAEPPKKKKLVFVMNPQNSAMAPQGRPQGQRRPDGHGPQGQGRPGERRPMNGQNQGPRTDRPQNIKISSNDRPVGQRPSDRYGEKYGVGQDDIVPVKKVEEHSQQTEKPQSDRPQNDRPQGDRPARPQGDRQGRPQGDRPARPQGNRPNYGDRPARPQGDRPNYGDRPARPQGDRPNYGDRPARPQGDRPNYGDRPARPQGDRPNFGDRQGRPQGGQGRPGNNEGRRFDNRNGGRPNGQDRRGLQGGFEAPDNRESQAKEQRSRDRENKKRDNNQHDKNERMENTKALEKQMKNRKKEEEEDTIRTLILPDTLTLKELADKMKIQPSVLVKKLFLQGKMVTMNDDIDFDTAEEIALEYNCICEHEVKVDVIEELLREEEDPEESLVARPPVVCVMGHVDHGKTSLLDAIRSSHVTEKEAGGITQHIGAYTVDIHDQKVTFLDTPGHEAFTAMRLRGAKSTDIAILVVAADDGVMPQSVEAINHATAAGIDIVVAVNKIDKPSANIERVKQELTEYELVAEDWGGSTIFCPVSAKTGEGLDNLLEMLLLTAEMRELKANPDRRARGLVIEAKLDKGRGPVATILVQKGTLHVGDFIAVGPCHGKIRAMVDDKGRRIQTAGPSIPVEVIGLDNVPDAGETFVSPTTDKEAKAFAETYIREGKEKLVAETKSKMSLEDVFSQIQAGNLKELDIIVKADVQGSVEAVKTSLLKLSNEEVVVKVIHAGVGAINESDVVLASASNAIIIGFNVRPDNQARDLADRENVDLRLYRVIYQAIEDIEAAMKGMLDPKFEEKITGHLEVRSTFKASQIGIIAGVFVQDGYVNRNASVRLMRGNDVIYDGPIASLKRFKDDAKEVKEGYECGVVLEKFQDIQEGDIMEVYMMVEIPRN